MLTDQAARTQAILPDQSFIVQAPAGSGKTELLTQRILSLLAFNAKSPESVLAITFTRKAAHEMRMRVIKALVAAQEPTPPVSAHQRQTWELARRVLAQDETLGWNLLNNPQRLQIMTIDALCTSLVRQMPVVSGMGGMPNISDHADHLCRKAAKITLIDLLNAQDPQLESLLLHLDNQQDVAVDLIASMLAKREQWLPFLIGLSGQQALREQLEENLTQVIEHSLLHVAESMDSTRWLECVSLLHFALSQVVPGTLPEALCDVLQWTWPLPNDISSLSAWKALYAWLFTTTGTVRKTLNKNNGFPATQEGRIRKNQMQDWLESFAQDEQALRCWKDIPLLPEPIYSQTQWSMLIALLHILPHACAQLELHHQTQSEMDFSGMAQAALRALGHYDDPSALTLKLDYQLQHILVDEFQDTSLLQYALLEKLVAGWMPNDGRTLFLVGDPMQSIYRFRQAEVGLFLRVQQSGLGDVAVQSLHLQANFRSDPQIIDWVNRVAPACFAQNDDIYYGAIAYSPSQAVREPKPNSQVALHATGNIIPCLEQLLQDESLQSIAILVRARAHLTDISAALQAAQIPYSAVELEHLSGQPLVQDLMALTRALHHLADSVAWLSVLRAPFCGFSLEDITLIRESNLQACVWDNLNTVNLSILSSDGQKIWHRIHPILADALQQRMTGRLSHTVEMLWLALGGPACLEQESDLRLASSFLHLLSKHEKGGTLPDLHWMLDELNKAFVKTRAGAFRVQVMTLHKAKGLEFDAVLMPELQKTTRSPDQPLLLWDELPMEAGQALLVAPIHPKGGEGDPIYNFLKYARAQKEAYQLGRLLYVGMTRAKVQLHLFARLSQDSDGKINPPKNDSLLALLWPQLGEDWMSIFDPTDELAYRDVGNVQSYRLSPDWHWPDGLLLGVPCISQPKTIDNQVPMDEFSYASHKQRQQGVLLHRMLYKMAMLGMRKWDKTHLKAQLFELGVIQGADVIVETIDKSLNQVLKDPRGCWILDTHPHHEAEAMYGSYVIDRTFVDEQGVRWIIDYKSSTVFDPSLYEQYRTQLSQYAQIFADRGEANIRTALYFPLTLDWHEMETLCR